MIDQIDTPLAAWVQQQVEVFFDESATLLDVPERLPDREEDEQIHHRDCEQKRRGHRGADDPANAPGMIEMQCCRGHRDPRGRQNDDRGVTHRKEEPHGHRPPALLHELARNVVDCSDVIGVHRMAQTEAIRQQRRAEQHGLVPEDQHRPDPNDQIDQQQQRIDRRDRSAQRAHAPIEKVAQQSVHQPRSPLGRSSPARWPGAKVTADVMESSFPRLTLRPRRHL
jgi:hypothetical protein